MKKALQISLAQTLFTIEEDAYLKLEVYLKSIKAHFAKTEGQEEIIRDIESRMSEQLLESGASIISLNEVEKVIASMGEVKDFADSDNDKEETAPAAEATKKKLYRNPDDKVIAGVCSGLAAYMNIDALWVRFGMLILFGATSGAGIIIYFILALVIPEAKTASQKLEMQGQPVNLETMSENVTEKSTTSRDQESTLKTILAWPFEALKTIVDLSVTYLGPFLRVAIGVCLALLSLAFILFLSVFAPLVLTNSDVYFDFPLSTIISPLLLILSVVGIYLSLVIPLAALFAVGIGLTLKRVFMNTTLLFSLLFIWCIAVVGAGISTANAVQKLELYTRTNPLYEETRQEVAVNETVTSVAISNNIRLTYVQGETAGLSLNGRARAMENLHISQDNGVLSLDLQSDGYFCLFCDNDSAIEATLTLPNLENIEAQMGSRIVAENLVSETPVTVTVTYGSRADLTITAPEIIATVESGSRLALTATSPLLNLKSLQGSHLTLEGTNESLTVLADHGSSFSAELAAITTVDANAMQGSRITLGEIDTLTATAVDGSRIEYLSATNVTDEADIGSRIMPSYGSEIESEDEVYE